MGFLASSVTWDCWNRLRFARTRLANGWKKSRTAGTITTFIFVQAEDGIRDRNVTGVQTCALPISASIPTIFLTGKTEAQAQVEAFDLGAVDYITKPINAKVLKARVRMHLALADRRYELERLVKERTEQLERTRTELIKRLGRAMQMHETAALGNRVLRLGHYAKLIAQAAGAKKEVAE